MCTQQPSNRAFISQHQCSTLPRTDRKAWKHSFAKCKTQLFFSVGKKSMYCSLILKHTFKMPCSLHFCSHSFSGSTGNTVPLELQDV